MIADLLESALAWLLGSSAQTTVILVLLIAIVYFRKALGLGSLLADWVGRLIFSAGVLLVLLVTGIIPGINVSRVVSLAHTAYALALEGFQQLV